MAKHRTFNADRFLDKLENHEPLLQAFVGLWKDRIELDVHGLTIAKFKTWLIDGSTDCKDEILEALYQVYDLCTDRGHEDLLAAGRDMAFDPDPDHVLPVECLALKVRTEREDIFTFAYDRYKFFRAERFTVYQGLKARPINDLAAATEEFNRQLGEAFQDQKGSGRVLVRHYVEEAYVNFIVYHEKRTRATLTLKGPKRQPKVQATIFRPAQQDFISYNQETGQVEIEAGIKSEETRLRRCFAQACFGDAEFFDFPGADERFDLDVIADPHFQLQCPNGVTATLVELRFELWQVGSLTFEIRSQDVLRTLDKNGLRAKLEGEGIKHAVFKIAFADDHRGKRVELTGTNKITFKRATHADDVFSILFESGILVNEKFHDGEDAGKFLDAKAAFPGRSDNLAS